MDLARMEKSRSNHKNTDQCHSLNQYLQCYSTDKKNPCEYLNDYIRNTTAFPELIMYDTFFLMCKSKISGVGAQDVDSFENLLQSALDLIWYMAPKAEKLRYQRVALPEFLSPILPFYDPTRLKQKAKQLCSETLINLVGKVTTVLEEFFVSQPLFKFLKELFDKLSKNAVTYSNYLVSNLESTKAYKDFEVVEREKTFSSLPNVKTDLKVSYSR